MKRMAALLLAAAFLAVPAYAFYTSPPEIAQINGLKEIEEYLHQSLPMAQQLEALASELRVAMGQTEQNGIFYTAQGLVKDLEVKAGQSVHSGNTREIIRFAERHQKPTYVMLIPTACAIKQQWVPKYAPLYNQKTFIDDTYRNFAGKVTVIDVYSTLFANRENTVFYGTDTNPTAYGGYLIYTAAAEKMKLTPYLADQFEQQYPVHDYYGDLYQEWSHRGVQPDILSTYHFKEGGIGYTVTHPYAEPAATYRSLYPTFKAEMGTPYAIYLGGYSPRIDIQATGHGHMARLLVLGDRTALSHLPFWGLHYGSVTFLDLAQLGKERIQQLDIQQYDQVLFAYSVESYLNTSAPRKAADIPVAEQK